MTDGDQKKMSNALSLNAFGSNAFGFNITGSNTAGSNTIGSSAAGSSAAGSSAAGSSFGNEVSNDDIIKVITELNTGLTKESFQEYGSKKFTKYLKNKNNPNTIWDCYPLERDINQKHYIYWKCTMKLIH